jgi:hypothetical protein
MKHKGLLAALAACAGIAFTGLPVPGAGDVSSKAYADSSKASKSKRASGVRGHYYIGGYYSYKDEDVAASRAWARSHFISRSIHRTPMADLQSRAGPFDSGFFFDSGLTPHYWNNSPYPN